MFVGKRMFPDGSFSDEIVKIPVDQFVQFIDAYASDEGKSALCKELSEGLSAKLVKEKVLPDLSFSSVLKEVLVRVGSKFAGQVGDSLMNNLVTELGVALSSVADGVPENLERLSKSFGKWLEREEKKQEG